MSADDLALNMEFAKFDLSWATVKSAYPAGYSGRVDRHRTQKRIVGGLASAASIGLTGAQYGTGVSALTLTGALVTGAAVSATGVGLVAARPAR